MSLAVRLIGLLALITLAVAVMVFSASRKDATRAIGQDEQAVPGETGGVADDVTQGSPNDTDDLPGAGPDTRAIERPPQPVNPTIDRYGVPVSSSAPVPDGAASGERPAENSTTGAGTPTTAPPSARTTGDSPPANLGADPGIYDDTSEFIDSDYIGPAPEASGAGLPDMPPPEQGAISYDVPPEGNGADEVGPPPDGATAPD
ncbi:MAG: hypothetical protein K0U72_15335 [Gammaproteobacteria bacterium]|nr:hypothetical protein [Gammaproteobacteria bacterium]